MPDIIHIFIVQRQYFDIATFASRVERFDYGSLEIGNHPPGHEITLERVASGSLKISASEMMCFSRNFCEMFGDLIPDDDGVWKLHLILREMSGIKFSQVFIRGTEVFFRRLVEAFLQLYSNLFHGQLTIKFQLLLHYADLMVLLGPLVPSRTEKSSSWLYHSCIVASLRGDSA